ncbi:MAG: hypothetical protein MUC73_12175, partial [Cyclobacteriaceae bacterium]|nr:hypothetical protein [Cyclobacteriaceae bacterium]
SRTYSVKGLNRELIRQLFFYDILSDKKETVKEPYTIYTRLQKAGSPITFSSYFGYQQKDIQGKSIAGADEHLLKAVLRDSTALTYLPLNFLYDLKTGNPISGITILPVDLNGNGTIHEKSKIFQPDISIYRLTVTMPTRLFILFCIGYSRMALKNFMHLVFLNRILHVWKGSKAIGF